jgi:transcriptional regulator with XRE-family HTH domain
MELFRRSDSVYLGQALRAKRTESNQVKSDENFQKLIGKKLRTLRREAGLSQRDLAMKMNLSHQQIQKYERGDNALPLQRVNSFASALGVAPVILVFPEIDRSAIGPAGSLSPDQAELLNLFEALPDRESRQRLLDLLRSLGTFANSLA